MICSLCLNTPGTLMLHHADRLRGFTYMRPCPCQGLTRVSNLDRIPVSQNKYLRRDLDGLEAAAIRPYTNSGLTSVGHSSYPFTEFAGTSKIRVMTCGGQPILGAATPTASDTLSSNY